MKLANTFPESQQIAARSRPDQLTIVEKALTRALFTPRPTAPSRAYDSD
jgi:hypothetical protein